MIELAVCLTFAAFFWPGVIIWARHLEGRFCLDDTRPTAYEVADLEAELPDVRDRWRRRR